MLATINTPKVQARFGVSLLHLVLIKRINENKTLQKCTFLMKVKNNIINAK
jgi:hypothetical protein